MSVRYANTGQRDKLNITFETEFNQNGHSQKRRWGHLFLLQKFKQRQDLVAVQVLHHCGGEVVAHGAYTHSLYILTLGGK